MGTAHPNQDANLKSDQRQHIMRKIRYAAACANILVEEQKRVAATLRVFVFELVQRCMSDVRPTLDLDWLDVVPPGQPRFRHKKIDLHPISSGVWA